MIYRRDISFAKIFNNSTLVHQCLQHRGFRIFFVGIVPQQKASGTTLVCACRWLAAKALMLKAKAQTIFIILKN